MANSSHEVSDDRKLFLNLHHEKSALLASYRSTRSEADYRSVRPEACHTSQLELFQNYYRLLTVNSFRKNPHFRCVTGFRGVLMKRCSENILQIYGRTPMPKCNFNKVAKQFY